MSSLHRAARLGREDDVADCLARGLNVNAVSVHGLTPLMLAALGGHVSTVLRLLDAGADPDIGHSNGRTALHFAASSGCLPMVELLAERGANLNAVARKGASPAIEAAQHGYGAVVNALSTMGADLNIRDKEGLSAEDWLLQGGLKGRLKASSLADNWRSESAIERSESHLRNLMERCPSPEEFAARHGRLILVWSYGAVPLRSEEVARWEKRVREIIESKELLAEIEDIYLQGDELAEAQRLRAVRARAAARRERRAANRGDHP